MSQPMNATERTLRQLQKLPANRSCFVCSALGAQYAVPACSIFVCTDCSGKWQVAAKRFAAPSILLQHVSFTFCNTAQSFLVVMCSMKAGLRVKSISMGKFSPEEVKQLEEGGNEVAASKYLAKWKAEGDARRPNSKNHMAVEAWVLTVLVDKRYYSESPASPATSSPGSQGQGNSHIPVRPMSELLGASQVKLQVGSTAQGQGQSKTGPPPSGEDHCVTWTSIAFMGDQQQPAMCQKSNVLVANGMVVVVVVVMVVVMITLGCRPAPAFDPFGQDAAPFLTPSPAPAQAAAARPPMASTATTFDPFADMTPPPLQPPAVPTAARSLPPQPATSALGSPATGSLPAPASSGPNPNPAVFDPFSTLPTHPAPHPAAPRPPGPQGPSSNGLDMFGLSSAFGPLPPPFPAPSALPVAQLPPTAPVAAAAAAAVTAGPPPAAAVQGSAAAMASVGSAALSGASTTSEWGAFEGAGALSLAGLGLQDTGAASGGALGASAPAEVKLGSQAGLGPPAGGSGSSSSNLVALTQQQQQQQQAALLGPSSMDWGAFTTDSVDSSSVSQTPAAAPAAAPAPTPAPAPPAAPALPAAPAPAKPGALTVREELPSDLFSIPALSPGPAAPPGPGPAATASHPAAPPHHHPWQPPQQPWQQQQQQPRHSTGAWPQSMAQPLPSQGPMQLSSNWGNPPQGFHPPPPPAAPHLHIASQPPAVIATYPGSTPQPPHPFLPHQPLQQAAGLVGSWAAGAGWAGGVGGGVHAGTVAPGHPPSFHPAAGTPGPVAVAANGAAPAAWSLGPAAGFPGGLAQGLHPAHGPALNVGRATHGAGSDAASSFGLFQAASPPQLAKPVLGSGPAVSGSSPPARSGAAPAARSSQDTFADLFTSSAGPPAAAGFAGQSGNPFA
ncbi:hypothetical protein QJQ45_019641 [Haematococcus lacustris]|nr:hypothetical protein QJQ45_019641 [Haematococcus lacustris]